MEFWLFLFVIAAIPFIVVVRLGNDHSGVRASGRRQAGVVLLACVVAVLVVIVVSVRLIQESFSSRSPGIRACTTSDPVARMTTWSTRPRR